MDFLSVWLFVRMRCECFQWSELNNNKFKKMNRRMEFLVDKMKNDFFFLNSMIDCILKAWSHNLMFHVRFLTTFSVINLHNKILKKTFFPHATCKDNTVALGNISRISDGNENTQKSATLVKSQKLFLCW